MERLEEYVSYSNLEDLNEYRAPCVGPTNMHVRYLSLRLRSQLTNAQLVTYIKEKGRLAEIQISWGRDDRKYREYVAAAQLALTYVPK